MFIVSQFNYTFYHSIAELYSIIVAYGVFVIAWNSRQFLNNNYILLIGIAYLFVGGFDLLHMLAYQGMGVFSGVYDNNLATQLWLAARYLQSFSFIVAPLFFKIAARTPCVLGLPTGRQAQGDSRNDLCPAYERRIGRRSGLELRIGGIYEI